MALDPVIQSYLDFLIAQRKKHWDRVVELRDYTNGEQATLMTDDQKILLVGKDANGNPNSDPEFNINVCGIILEALVDRLDIRGIKITVPDNETLSEEVSKQAWSWWEASDMGEGSQSAHFAATRDGDSYPIVDYSLDSERPVVVNNQTYDGDSGVEMAYEDGHPNKPLYAVKRWQMQRPTVNNATTNRVQRMNVYFDNRIEYYISVGQGAGSKASGWRRLEPGDRDFVDDKMTEEVQLDPYNRQYTATVAWQTTDGTPTGEPLGLNVKHLRNNARGDEYGRSRIGDIAPALQDAINRAGLSLQAAALLNGFKEMNVTGHWPSVKPDGTSTAVVRSPSAVHYYENKDVTVSMTEETNLEQLISVVDNWIVKAATLTATPLSLFNLTSHTPAEGTQKQLEQSLVIAGEKAQKSFDATWQSVVRQMVIFDATFNENSIIPDGAIATIDSWDIDIIWEPVQSRSEVEERQIAVIDKEQLGVPVQSIWPRFFNAEEIKVFEDALVVQQGRVFGEMAQRLKELEEQNAQAEAAGTNGANNGTNREPVTAGAN